MSASRGRDTALDVFRGVCVVSMTFGHIAAGTLPFQITHAIPSYDGASGFVLLAGLVIGMVQRRKSVDRGITAARAALGRRTLVLYLNHVGLVLLGLVVGSATMAAWYLPDASSEGGWRVAVARALTLQLNPPGVDILSMYIVLLMLGGLAVTALLYARLVLVLLGTISLYAVAQLIPSLTTLRGYEAAADSGFNWGAWQIIFLSALVVGWYWEARGLHRLLRKWQVAIVAFGAAVMLAALSNVDGAFTEWFFHKNNAGPGWVLMSWAVFMAVYWGMSKAPRFIGSWLLHPLEAMGRRSLDSFVLMTCALLVLPAALGGVPSGNRAVAAAIGSLVVMTLWALARDGYARRRPRRRNSASPGEEIPISDARTPVGDAT